MLLAFICAMSSFAQSKSLEKSMAFSDSLGRTISNVPVYVINSDSSLSELPIETWKIQQKGGIGDWIPGGEFLKKKMYYKVNGKQSSLSLPSGNVVFSFTIPAKVDVDLDDYSGFTKIFQIVKMEEKGSYRRFKMLEYRLIGNKEFGVDELAYFIDRKDRTYIITLKNATPGQYGIMVGNFRLFTFGLK